MIEVKNLTKKFGRRTILNNLNVHFEGGKIYALIGESGSGKTTLLNILAKLETFDAGKVIYKGKDLQTIKSREYFRDEMGYLFQDFGLMSSETVEKNLDLGLIGKRLSKAEKVKREKEAMERVHIGYLNLSDRVYTLSGGEAQRVALAKVFLKDPPLILADEPTASLDPKTAEDILNILFSMRNPKRVIILATHSPQIWDRTDAVVKLTAQYKKELEKMMI